MSKPNTPPAAPGTPAEKTKRPRTARTPEQTVEAAHKAVARASASVMALHLKALSTDALAPISTAAKALNSALVAPPAAG